MLLFAYILVFAIGVVLGSFLFATLALKTIYGGEIDLNDGKLYTEDWIYENPDRKYALFKIERGEKDK